MCAGFITISKKLLKWEWMDEPLMLALWIHLLLKANYEEKQWHGIKVQRGQLITSSVKLAQEAGMTRRQIRTRLDVLQKSGCIAIKTTNKYSIITICKYDTYQLSNSNERPAEGHSNDQQTVTQMSTTKEYNKEINNNITPISPLQGESPKRKKKSLEERKEEFYNTIIPYVDKYGKQMCREFYEYWIEPYQHQDKMRFEGQKTWSVSLRLATWAKREKGYGTADNNSSKLRAAEVTAKTAEEYDQDF